MKKLLLSGIMACVMAGGVSAQKATLLTQGNMWAETAGMMALGMSDNGRYICGSCYSGEGFVFDCETNKLVLTSDFPQSHQGDMGNNQFYAVTNDGVAYGWDALGGVALGIDGTYDLFFPIPANWEDVAPYAVTADGSIVAGFVYQSFYDIKPCYWTDGEIHYLPFSTAEEAGFAINKGAKATAISSDGSIIMGNIENRSSYNPMVYWKRQDDGTYEYKAAFLPYYEDIYDGSTLRDNYHVGKYSRFMPFAMSRNGKTIALLIQEVHTTGLSPFEVALYDTDTDTFEIIPYNSKNFLYSREGEFGITGISDNGYITGYAGSPFTGPVPFVMKPKEYSNAQTLSQTFPDSELLKDWNDNIQGYGVYLTTGISADASYIGGYVEVILEDLGMTGYGAFRIATAFNGPIDPEPDPEPDPDDPDSGVGLIDAATAAPVYYNLQGQPVANPEHGIFIRKQGAKTEKIVL